MQGLPDTKPSVRAEEAEIQEALVCLVAEILQEELKKSEEFTKKAIARTIEDIDKIMARIKARGINITEEEMAEYEERAEKIMAVGDAIMKEMSSIAQEENEILDLFTLRHPDATDKLTSHLEHIKSFLSPESEIGQQLQKLFPDNDFFRR